MGRGEQARGALRAAATVLPSAVALRESVSTAAVQAGWSEPLRFAVCWACDGEGRLALRQDGDCGHPTTVLPWYQNYGRLSLTLDIVVNVLQWELSGLSPDQDEAGDRSGEVRDVSEAEQLIALVRQSTRP